LGGLKCSSTDTCLQLISARPETKALGDRLSALARLADRLDRELDGNEARPRYRQVFACFAMAQILETIGARR
jgi:hypothetical protein